MPQLEQKLQPRLIQKLIITPQLQQAIKLLQLSKLDLQEEISQELVENPALEELPNALEVSAPPLPDNRAEDRSTQAKGDDFDVDAFFNSEVDDWQPSGGTYEHRDEEIPTADQLLRATGGLSDHLLWQLEMSLLAPGERQIGEAIIGNIDERGYLEATAEEIAAMAPSGTTWTTEQVETVRHLIQEFDPIGVGSRNLQECLMVQLELAGEGDSAAIRAVRDHLPLLEAKKHAELARALEIPPEEVEQMLELLRGLDPHPGEKFNPRPSAYIVPDVYVIKDGDDYRVLLNEEGLPRLRISPSYRRFFARPEGLGGGDATARDFVREKVRAAVRLIRSLEERQRTIYKVATSIVKHQRPFLDRGIEAIRPLVLRDVAEDIGMHESTVSRVVNNKYMHTHRGLFEMRFFFHSGLAKADGGDAISSLTIKEKIRRMVAEEDSKQPLSDQAIAEELRKDGLQIARRTVAKYREELRIAPSTARKR